MTGGEKDVVHVVSAYSNLRFLSKWHAPEIKRLEYVLGVLCALHYFCGHNDKGRDGSPKTSP